MPKPTVSTKWATSDDANKVPAGPGVQQYGLHERSGVPHELLNSQFDNINQWIEYFKGRVLVFGSVKDFLDAGLDVGDIGVVQPIPNPPMDLAWTKTAADLGGHNSVAVCSDGSKLYLMTAGVGGDIEIFDARDGTDLNPGETLFPNPGHSIGRLRTDGRYLYQGFDTSNAIWVLDPTQNTPLSNVALIENPGNVRVVDFCVDGEKLYLIDEGEDLRVYENLSTNPSIDWEDNASLSTVASLKAISTNGRNIAVSHAPLASGSNLSLFSTSGGLVGARELDPSADPDGGQVLFLRDHLLAASSNDKLWSLPGYGNEMGGARAFQVSRSGEADGTNAVEANPHRLVACGPYIAQAVNTATHGYITLFKWMGSALLPVFVKRFDQGVLGPDTVVDIALGPDHFAIATKPLASSSNVLTCYQLPPRRLHLRIADHKYRYRAPFYGAVACEEG